MLFRRIIGERIARSVHTRVEQRNVVGEGRPGGGDRNGQNGQA